MDDWLDSYAETLGLEGLGPEHRTLLLDLARDVAHGTERKNAPLATFLAGVYAGASGADLDDALEQAVARAQDRLGG